MADRRSFSRSRKWCWTLFARNDAEADDWCLNATDAHLPVSPVGPSYWVYQVEVCPETNRVHLQGFSYYENAVSLRRAKLDVAPTAHVERARGTVEENINYCSKSDSAIQGPFEHGQKPTQGRRTDWHDARQIVVSGGTDAEILDLHPNLAPNFRGVEKMREVYGAHPIRRDIRVFYLWGGTGVGKTHRARMSFPDAYMIRGKFVEGKLFDNYKGERELILDEWDWHEWPLTAMNTFLDPFGFWVTCRYQNRWAAWSTVIITSNDQPDACYYGQNHYATFQRRLTYKFEILGFDTQLPF